VELEGRCRKRVIVRHQLAFTYECMICIMIFRSIFMSGGMLGSAMNRDFGAKSRFQEGSNWRVFEIFTFKFYTNVAVISITLM
jgi:hypothetical protein